MDWQPIETAPKDGTVVRVRNGAMREPVEARWGEYVNPWGGRAMEWVLVKDSDRFTPLRPGTLVIPSEWSHLPVPPQL